MKIHLIDANNYLRRKFESSFNVPSIVPLLSPEPMFWVFDGKGALKARQDLYPGYKAKRDRETPTNNGAYAMLQTIREELLIHTGGYIVRVPGMEADDIIAHLAWTFSGQGIDVWVESNDGDFHSLVDERVTLATPPGWTSEIAPKDVRLYKTLVGDQSDNIPGLKGFGEKGWKALSEGERQLWKEFFQGGTDCDIRSMLKPSQLEWFNAGGDKLLRIFWKVVGFLPVTDGLINRHTVAGVKDAKAYSDVLRKYMWTI